MFEYFHEDTESVKVNPESIGICSLWATVHSKQYAVTSLEENSKQLQSWLQAVNTEIYTFFY